MISICICDDYEKSRAITKKLLSVYKEIHIVAEADSGTALFLLLEKGLKVDIVLLDIAMPDMNGYEVCNRIKQHFPDVKVIGYSGFSKSGAVLKLLLNGAIGFVEKQVNVTPLYDIIIDAISSQSVIKNQWVTPSLLKEFEKYQKLTDTDLNYATNYTDKEIQIIQLLQNGFTFSEVAHSLGSSEYGIRIICDQILNSLPQTKISSKVTIQEKQLVEKK
ncbi:MAG: response regulator [Chitinophagaceae bacterium]